MLHRILTAVLLLGLAILGPGRACAQDAAPGKVAIKKVADVMTLWSLAGEPKANASHTFVLTHGLMGIDDRFDTLGHALLAKHPQACVLILDWTPGADKRIRKVPNPYSAAECIDCTGDALGITLVRLAKKGCFDSKKATFIGESFGNWVNNRAAIVLRKEGLGKVERALVLNPASEFGGYSPPSMKGNFNQSAACVSDSYLDTRDAVAQRLIVLRPTGKGQVERHTAGMTWLLDSLAAGEDLNSHFQRSAAASTTRK